MKSKKLINNIKSKDILYYIFSYIKDKNFKDKLFLYSKELQEHFVIKLIGLKENYLKKIGFDLNEYLYIEPNLFEKDFLANAYNKFLKENNLDKKNIEKIIFDIYEYKEIKDIDEKYFDKMKKIYIHYLKYFQKLKILEKYLQFIFHKKF